MGFVKEHETNVVQAAQRRIIDLFNKEQKVIMSVSGGKDSICLSHIVIKTMREYGIDFSRLVVVFFDEEAIYPDIERITMDMRREFLALGAKFYWFCLPIRHYNCCNRLSNDESFFCWDPRKKDVWVRQMPKFAITEHKKFKFGMSYQEFSNYALANCSNMCGIRMNESLQRRQNVYHRREDKHQVLYYPIYDWTDDDVWKYIKDNDLEIPETYIYLYKVGVHKNKLRISQFFSIDTIKTLPKMMEFYPELY